MIDILSKFENNRKFTEKEAKLIFKLAAYSEAIGWLILITGIVIGHIYPNVNTYSLPIAGQIHGTIFVGYFIILLSVYPSLKWSRTNFLFSIVAGVVPFGTLVFELVMAHKYHDNKQESAVSMLIRQNNSLLAAQPSHGVEWQLPVINADLDQSLEKQIIPKIKELFNMEPTLHTHIINTNQALIEINFPRTINNLDLSDIANKIPLIDELCFIKKADSPELFSRVERFRSIDATA